uniref:Uncharacterized protein n=1 Tax=Callorhinchus milii TaxID=7868 RepID=A0A4W3HMI6_CALMI
MPEDLSLQWCLQSFPPFFTPGLVSACITLGASRPHPTRRALHKCKFSVKMRQDIKTGTVYTCGVLHLSLRTGGTLYTNSAVCLF